MLLATCYCLLTTPATGQTSPPSFVAGDLIVKFTDASEFGIGVTQALRADQVNNASLRAMAERLSADLGITLSVARVTSGRELVLSIQRDALVQTIRQGVMRDPAVRDVMPVSAKTLLPSPQIALNIKLVPNSAAQRRVRQVAQAGRRTSRAIDQLVARWMAGVYPQPTGQVDDHGQLVLTVDVASLTRDLAMRLKRRPDVEYAQTSQIARPLNDGEVRKYQ